MKSYKVKSDIFPFEQIPRLMGVEYKSINHIGISEHDYYFDGLIGELVFSWYDDEDEKIKMFPVEFEKDIKPDHGYDPLGNEVTEFNYYWKSISIGEMTFHSKEELAKFLNPESADEIINWVEAQLN